MCMDIFFTGYSSHEDQHTKLGDFRHYLISDIMLSCSNPLFQIIATQSPPGFCVLGLPIPQAGLHYAVTATKTTEESKGTLQAGLKPVTLLCGFREWLTVLETQKLSTNHALFMHMQSHNPTKSCTTAKLEA